MVPTRNMQVRLGRLRVHDVDVEAGDHDENNDVTRQQVIRTL